MVIRLGYACISETLNSITTSKTYTYTNYEKERDDQKLENIIRSNLISLAEILKYNIRNDCHFYRLSSKLIPLATHDNVDFDYLDKFNCEYDNISNLINSNKLRIDFHPDQFCVLNSVYKNVLSNSINILKYHFNLLEKINVNEKILVLHIGGCTFGKDKSLKRFINNYNKLPDYLKGVIAIENDDKIFTIDDCLYLSSKLNIPVVLDYHHYVCNRGELDLFENIENIFDTWKNINPKIHFSSPKSKLKKEFRSHHDYIDSDTFIEFIEKIKYLDYDIDIMIEAKKKDEAMFRLIRELKYKTNYKFVDSTTFIP